MIHVKCLEDPLDFVGVRKILYVLFFPKMNSLNTGKK